MALMACSCGAGLGRQVKPGLPLLAQGLVIISYIGPQEDDHSGSQLTHEAVARRTNFLSDESRHGSLWSVLGAQQIDPDCRNGFGQVGR